MWGEKTSKNAPKYASSPFNQRLENFLEIVPPDRGKTLVDLIVIA
jgi:hypothetical protein